MIGRLIDRQTEREMIEIKDNVIHSYRGDGQIADR